MYWYDPYTDYYESIAEKAYPEEYHKILPYIKKICKQEDHPYNHTMYPFPKPEKINEMVEEIYSSYRNEEDNGQNKFSRGRHGGCDDVFCDIVKILLIKELIDRRRCRRRSWWYW